MALASDNFIDRMLAHEYGERETKNILNIKLH